MAQLTAQERLQPSLLDRLQDDATNETRESSDKRVFSIDRLRESVLRDLAWLLNTSNLEQTEDLDQYPEVKTSVLNYGVPEMAGSHISTTDLTELERFVKQAVLDFEPRILPDTVKVRVVVSDSEEHHNRFTLEIEGDMWSQPLPLQIYVNTTVDLESGDINLDQYLC